jgi:hypothetical protein
MTRVWWSVCLLVLSPIALVVGGCAGIGANDEEARVTKADLEELVLHQSDLGRRFTLFDYGELQVTDFQAGPREDPARFERQGGWKARYRRSPLAGAPRPPGPLLVVSIVDLFAGSDGAKSDLMAYESELSESGEVTEVDVGDEAVGKTRLVGGVRYIDIAWRRANVTGSVSVSGLAESLSLTDAVALARRQDRRVSRALAARR